MLLHRFSSLTVHATKACQAPPTTVSCTTVLRAFATKYKLTSHVSITKRSSIHSTPSLTRHFSSTPTTQNSSSNRSAGPGVTPPSPSRSSTSSPSSSSTSNSTKNKDSKLDPDKIKGPGGLTMTQIGKLVQQSRARDLEHLKSKAAATGSSTNNNNNNNSSSSNKRK